MAVCPFISDKCLVRFRPNHPESLARGGVGGSGVAEIIVFRCYLGRYCT